MVPCLLQEYTLNYQKPDKTPPEAVLEAVSPRWRPVLVMLVTWTLVLLIKMVHAGIHVHCGVLPLGSLSLHARAAPRLAARPWGLRRGVAHRPPAGRPPPYPCAQSGWRAGVKQPHAARRAVVETAAAVAGREYSILPVMSELSTVWCDRALSLWIAGTLVIKTTFKHEKTLL